MDKLLVEFGGIHSAIGESTAQSVVALTLRCKHSIADGLHRGLHGTRQAVADAVARLDAHVEPTLQDARFVIAGAKTGSMKQTEHQTELGVFVLLQHTAEVELYVGELHQLSGVADDTQKLSVADDAIHILRGVEIFEHGGMSRLLAHAAFGTIVERTLVQSVNASVCSDILTNNDKRHIA